MKSTRHAFVAALAVVAAVVVVVLTAAAGLTGGFDAKAVIWGGTHSARTGRMPGLSETLSVLIRYLRAENSSRRTHPNGAGGRNPSIRIARGIEKTDI
ncbi:hypothetical protein AB0H76_23105 [Nocardia sp. NPDC050712]|uniref:hypothetical protein n=1 Tax=Nocardia sp. NPDC050712 TaxID=3155518 RepID=UPI0034087DBF